MLSFTVRDLSSILSLDIRFFIMTGYHSSERFYLATFHTIHVHKHGFLSMKKKATLPEFKEKQLSQTAMKISLTQSQKSQWLGFF